MTSTQDSTYPGSCHCGGIGFLYRTTQSPEKWNIRACQCTFCRTHAALSTSDPAGQIEFRFGPTLNRYKFGKHTADFLVCRECGVFIGAMMESASGSFGIINVNALNPQLMAFTAAAPMDYGSETQEQRTARREERWSPLALAGV